jgi:hypothetical protein
MLQLLYIGIAKKGTYLIVVVSLMIIEKGQRLAIGTKTYSYSAILIGAWRNAHVR